MGMSALRQKVTFMPNKPKAEPEKPLLHLVFGGRVTDPTGLDFEDFDKLDIVGIFPSYAQAEAAWRGAAQRTVDDAQMKYVVVHLHKLLEPHDDDDHAH
jgi:hypothetical protein